MQVDQMRRGMQNTFDIRDARFRPCVGDNRPDVARDGYREALMDVAKRIGVRIRACRERAGMTQGELAAAAFVTLQSVGNWENGKTLPDVQSLQLVARSLGTTVDGILGDEVPAIVAETAEARRQLARYMVLYGALYLVHLACVLLFVRFAAEGNHYAKLGVLAIVLIIALGEDVATRRVRSITRGRELGDAVSVMMFVEGYPEGQEPPNNVFYRVILTNLPAVMTVLYTLIVLVCIVLSLL